MLNGQLTGTDVETPAELTFNLVSGPASGTLTLNPDGTFSYDPVANFNGTVSFVFTVTDTGDDELDCGCPLEPSGFTPDGPDTSAPKTVTINVLPVNDPPVAMDDAYGTPAGQSLVVTTALGVLANDTDVEGNALSVDTVVDNVDNGTLTLQADGGFTYTPNAGFSGIGSVHLSRDRRQQRLRRCSRHDHGSAAAERPAGHGERRSLRHPARADARLIGANLIANDTDPDGDPCWFRVTRRAARRAARSRTRRSTCSATRPRRLHRRRHVRGHRGGRARRPHRQHRDRQRGERGAGGGCRSRVHDPAGPGRHHHRRRAAGQRHRSGRRCADRFEFLGDARRRAARSTNPAFDTFVYTPPAGFTGDRYVLLTVPTASAGSAAGTRHHQRGERRAGGGCRSGLQHRPGQTLTIVGATCWPNDTDPDGDPLIVSNF